MLALLDEQAFEEVRGLDGSAVKGGYAQRCDRYPNLGSRLPLVSRIRLRLPRDIGAVIATYE